MDDLVNISDFQDISKKIFLKWLMITSMEDQMMN